MANPIIPKEPIVPDLTNQHIEKFTAVVFLSENESGPGGEVHSSPVVVSGNGPDAIQGWR